jgi:alkylation response protein AidB-like acyl-CoA dehydrogenase
MGLILSGSDDLKKQVLPSLTSGEAMASYVLSDRESGSDSAAMRPRAPQDGTPGFSTAPRRGSPTAASQPVQDGAGARAQVALDAAIAYTKERKQFGNPMSDFQGVHLMLADMATKVEAARLMVYTAAAPAERGEPALGFISSARSASPPMSRWRSPPTQCSCSAAPATPRTSRSSA